MPPIRHHGLARRDFAALARGEGSAAIVTRLLASERSWRVAALRALLDAVTADPAAAGPLDFDAAWALLGHVKKVDAAAADGVVNHPQTGVWAAYTLRRLRGSTHAETPIWVDVGHLNALAAAAAIRAGVAFTLSIPVRDGTAALPTLGSANLPGSTPWRTADLTFTAAGVLRLTCEGVTIEVIDADLDSEQWRSLRGVRPASGHGGVHIVLDDVSPFRDLQQPTPPRRLPAAAIQRWQERLDGAWDLLRVHHPGSASALGRAVSVLAPLPATERFRPLSASNDEAFGAVLASEPDDAVQLAVTLVHELQHNQLGALQHLVSLYDDDTPAYWYAPWRDDPRPLSGLLQGIYAFQAVTGFWRIQRHSEPSRYHDLAQFEFALWRRQTWQTAVRLGSAPQLRDLGREFVRYMGDQLEAWQREPVPAWILRLADTATADHRALWRAYHLRPDAGLVASATRAWLDGAPCPALTVDAVVAADDTVHQLDARAVLMRWRLLDHCRADELAIVAADIGGATPADAALVSGRLDLARSLYGDTLTSAVPDAGALVGLGLTLAATGDPAAPGFLDRPELLLAICRAVGSGRHADPIGVAAWLAGAASL